MVCSLFQISIFMLLTPTILSSCIFISSSYVVESLHYSSERNTKMMELASDSHKRWSMMESISKNPDCWTVCLFVIFLKVESIRIYSK